MPGLVNIHALKFSNKIYTFIKQCKIFRSNARVKFLLNQDIFNKYDNQDDSVLSINGAVFGVRPSTPIFGKTLTIIVSYSE